MKTSLSIILLLFALQAAGNPPFVVNREVGAMLPPPCSETYYAPNSDAHVICENSDRLYEQDTPFVFSSSDDFDFLQISGCNSSIQYLDSKTASCQLNGLGQEDTLFFEFFNAQMRVASYELYYATDIEGQIHISSRSIDAAKRNAGIDVGYGFSPGEDAIRVEDTNQTRAIGATGTVTGTLTWQDEQGYAHPLVGAKVRLSIEGSPWWSDAYTNNQGYYAISYEGIWYIGSGKPTVTITLKNDKVALTAGVGAYSYSHQFPGNSGFQTWNYTISPANNGDFGKASMIFEGVNAFANYAADQNGGVNLPFLNLYYPISQNEESLAHYSSGAIWVKSVDGGHDPNRPSSYAAWDVIGHEYGHHVNAQFGIANSPGGIHYVRSNAIDDRTQEGTTPTAQTKGEGLRIAWAEGFATYWSISAQQHFSADFQSIRCVGDTYYSSPDVFEVVDAYGGNPRGEADEVSVQCLLYKLYSEEIDAYDRFALGDNLFSLLRSASAESCSEFIQFLYDRGFDPYDLGALLSQYKMAPATVSIFDNYLDKLPTFSWSTDFGSNFLRFNAFSLVFLDENKNGIFTVDNLRSEAPVASYTLSPQQWHAIHNAEGHFFFVAVKASQTDFFVTGNCYSEAFVFEKTRCFSSSKSQLVPCDWPLSQTYQSITTSGSFSMRGMTFTAQGTRCAYQPLGYIGLKASSARRAEATFEVVFGSPVYSLMVGFSLLSNNENIGSITCELKTREDEWVEIFETLNSSDLPVIDQGVKRFKEYYGDGIMGFRVVVMAGPISSGASGCLCIDDVVLGLLPMPNDIFYITNYPRSELEF